MAYRVCAACDDNEPDDCYSNNQWAKGVGRSRCRSCVTNEHFGGESNSHSTRVCRSCESKLDCSEFSSSQWAKGVGASRCTQCVSKGFSSRDDFQATARVNESCSASYSMVLFAQGPFVTFTKAHTLQEGAKAKLVW
jgi:hypothetical protein